MMAQWMHRRIAVFPRAVAAAAGAFHQHFGLAQLEFRGITVIRRRNRERCQQHNLQPVLRDNRASPAGGTILPLRANAQP
jgi:hypothetical protein